MKKVVDVKWKGVSGAMGKLSCWYGDKFIVVFQDSSQKEYIQKYKVTGRNGIVWHHKDKEVGSPIRFDQNEEELILNYTGQDGTQTTLTLTDKLLKNSS